MIHHHTMTGSNSLTSEESLNEDEEEDDDAGNGGGLRMLHPQMSNPSILTTNHHNHNSSHPRHIHQQKSFPPSTNKVLRAAPLVVPLCWKAANEMIGVSAPRKARSACIRYQCLRPFCCYLAIELT